MLLCVGQKSIGCWFFFCIFSLIVYYRCLKLSKRYPHSEYLKFNLERKEKKKNLSPIFCKIMLVMLILLNWLDVNMCVCPAPLTLWKYQRRFVMWLLSWLLKKQTEEVDGLLFSVGLGLQVRAEVWRVELTGVADPNHVVDVASEQRGIHIIITF